MDKDQSHFHTKSRGKRFTHQSNIIHFENSGKTNYINQVSFYPRQHAYQMGTSTETALVELTVQIQDALMTKGTVVYVLLQIDGAFDNTLHEAVEKALI